MLSRIAESLFWIGRYLERADNTSRILDVQIHQLLEDAFSDEAIVARSMLEVLGGSTELGSSELVDISDVISLLAFDTSNASSIVSSISAARENARGIRETISSELWECLNVTFNATVLRASKIRSQGPAEFFRYARFVRERIALAAGIAETTMQRDEGWRFLTLGRYLERADMTIRLLAMRLALPPSGQNWIATLRSCSAHESYLRTFGGQMDANMVVEFILLDGLFPRSVLFSLRTAEDALRAILKEEGRMGPEDQALRTLARARATLEFRSSIELFSDLETYLEAVEQACSDATIAIAERFFQGAPLLSWNLDEDTGIVELH